MGLFIAEAFDLAAYRPGVIAACYFVAAAVCLAMMILVITGGRRDEAGRWARTAFGVNVGLVVLVLVAVGGRHSAGSPAQAAAAARLALAGFAAIGPSTLSFVCALIGWRVNLRLTRIVSWVFGLAGSAAAVFTPLAVRGATGSGHAVRVMGGTLLPLILLVVVTQLAIALALCATRARATPDATLRHQLRAVLFAYGVGALGSLDVVRLWNIAVPPSSFLWLALAAAILSYAARAHHLLDTPALGWRALAWLGASTLAAAPAPILLVATQGWRGWAMPSAGALALETIFLGMIGYAWRAQPAIDELFLRRRRDLARDLDELAETLLVVRTVPALAAEVVRVLGRSLYARVAVFAVRDEEGGWRALETTVLPRDDEALAAALADRRDPLTRADVAAMPPSAARETVARWLDRAGAAALVPLALPDPRAGLLGLCALAPRRDGTPLVAVELTFLRRLAATVADALEAARLYERRQQLRDELEDKVRARAADLARARDRLVKAQDSLVQREKMATLGLVVGGVAAELEAAVAEVALAVPELQRDLATCDAAAARALAALPDDDETRDWLADAAIDHVREDVRPLVAAIAEGARRARAIAGDLSLFARPAAADPAASVELAAEVAAALRLLAPELAGRIEVVRDLPADLPRVAGDAGALGQVLMNLLANAAQAIEGKGRIVVAGRAIDGGERVEIAIRDTGKGIAPEHLPHIFEPFFSTKTAGGGRGGSGLGLFVSYGIVQRHGGELRVESERGKGTEMQLRLVSHRSQ